MSTSKINSKSSKVARLKALRGSLGRAIKITGKRILSFRTQSHAGKSKAKQNTGK